MISFLSFLSSHFSKQDMYKRGCRSACTDYAMNQIADAPALCSGLLSENSFTSPLSPSIPEHRAAYGYTDTRIS